mgnify:CR=1 FL=1
MRCHNKIQLLSVMNDHLVAYPTPMNLNYAWNGGSLAGMMLASQMLTGILLAMHYVGHVDYAFASVQHLMTDVPSGMILRYAHANGASLFFIVVYLHVLRGMYYGSGAQPREMVWITGVVILLLMIITAFIGYVLPWGCIYGPKDFIFCCVVGLKRGRMPYGPYNKDVISLFFGCLLGDSYAEKRSGSTRIQFKQSSRNVAYLMWFHKFLADRGYCNPEKPVKKTTINKNGKTYYSYQIRTWSSANLNWIYDAFYVNSVKQVPTCIHDYLDEFALAVWIMVDGGRSGGGVLLATYCFSYEQLSMLVSVLENKFGLKCSIQKKTSGPVIYVFKESMPKLRSIVLPYLVPSMRYKVKV